MFKYEGVIWTEGIAGWNGRHFNKPLAHRYSVLEGGGITVTAWFEHSIRNTRSTIQILDNSINCYPEYQEQ